MTINYNCWMKDNWSVICNKNLSQLCLPGTHDSGTSNLLLELAPDATPLINNLFNYGDTDSNSTGVREYIRNQATSQPITIGEQLEKGFRYIDLRVCNMGGVYYCCHSLKGVRISQIMTEIRNFLTTNTSEVVVIKVGLKEINGDQEVAKAYEFLQTSLNYDNQTKNLAVKITNENICTSFGEFAGNGKRCLLLPDDGFIDSSYNASATTNQSTVEQLEKTTKEFNGGATTLLEAQCFRPTSDQNYALGYLQGEGAIALGPLAAIEGVGYNFASTMKEVFTGSPLPAVPKNLAENARNSRTIVRDYFNFLNQNPSLKKPSLVICDYANELPLVEICLAICTGQPLPDLSDIQDVPIPQLRTDWFTTSVWMAPNLVAGAAMAAGLGATAASKYLQENVPGITGEILGGALKGAGYALNEVAAALHDVMGFAADTVNTVLSGIGYVADEIEDVFEDMGDGFVDFFEDVGETMNPSNW